MTNVIAENVEGYENIANVIGKRIDENFQKLLIDLISGNINSLSSNEQSVTKADLENFLTVLGSANISINFSPKLLKGTVKKFSATDVQSDASILGGSISVSIGGSWSF